MNQIRRKSISVDHVPISTVRHTPTRHVQIIIVSNKSTRSQSERHVPVSDGQKILALPVEDGTDGERRCRNMAHPFACQ
jgi:hypothetical protein